MRALKVAVAVMGVLFIGGFATLVTLLVQRMSSGTGGIASAVLDQPVGTRIAAASAAQDRLVVQLQGGGPDRVIVLDVRSGRVLGTVGLAR